MKKLPRFISAFTPDYEEMFNRLDRSAREFGVTVNGYRLTETGSWLENCAKKSGLVFRSLVDFEVPTVWIDADAEFKQRPELFEFVPGEPFAFDFAVCDRGDPLGFGSGTVFFSPRATHLACLWAELCRTKPEEIDQVLLERCWRTLDAFDLRPRTRFLPRSYLKKFDDPDVEEAVVLHYQASRSVRSRKP